MNISLRADFQRCKRVARLWDSRIEDAFRGRLGRVGSIYAGTLGNALTTSLVGGDSEVDFVVQDPKSLSGGVGGGLVKLGRLVVNVGGLAVNVGGLGVDLGPGGIYTGVSYGLGGRVEVTDVFTPRESMQSSEDVPRRRLELLPYLV